ncbi:hypothetical protein KKB40_04670, partial [Patescibacteria group bacterium]|nr:hypothetical protein [Patescibacteria group bacterium]
GFMFSLMALVLVCMALIGPKGMNLYPEFISITETGIYGSNLLSQPTFLSSIFNLSKFINLSTTLIYLANLIAFLIFFVLFFRNYKKRSLKNNFCAATLFTLAFAPHAWEHDFILLLMPILYLLEVSLKTKRGASRKLPILFATFLYLSWTLRFVASPFMISFIMIGVGGIMLLHPFFLRTKEM